MVMPTGRSTRRGEADDRFGPYRVVRPLAEGGMGIVYAARHDISGEEVALKIVRVAEESLLASFRREVFALRSIHHPAVARIVDDGVTDGQPWYAMSLVDGPTLGDYISDIHATGSYGPHDSIDTPLSDSGPGTQIRARAAIEVRQLPRTLRIMHALCEPLAYLHGQGLVHRDLKPDNIVLDDDVPILVDFGLALRFGGGEGGRDVLDVAGRALGTPPYMAPEQIRGELVDARADLYALGCLLYECVTGSPPFTGSSVAILNRHLDERPSAPSSHVLGVPEHLDKLILRLLAKRPRDRLGYAADVRRALADAGAPLVLRRWPHARPYLYLPGLAGRAGVLEQLARDLAPRPDARGGFVLVVGESGVGKTRLATELATTAARRGYAVVTGRCLDLYATGGFKAAPLHPLRPLLGAIADRCRAGGAAETERLLGAHAAVFAPYEPSFASLADKPAADLPPDAARHRLLSLLTPAIRAYGERQPLFLVLDDLQWADDLSLELLRHLDAAFFREADVFIVGTVRIDEQTSALASLLEEPHVKGIELGALSRRAVATMVGDMLALDDPPSALIDFLMDASEGNPFFIAEYLRLAIATSVLQRDEAGIWSLGRWGRDPNALRAELGVPGGLRDLVSRRWQLLDPAARRLAELAAVIGRELDGDVLLAGGARVAPEDDVRAAVETLRARQILEEDERGGLRFVHDKLREHVYEQIAVTRRPALHLIAAETIEARFEARDDFALAYATLAHHYGSANHHDKTLHYLERAGEQALSTAASADAKRYFSRAIELGDTRHKPRDEALALRRAKWERGLGEACYNLGELEGARRHLGAALSRLGTRPALAQGRVAMAVSSFAALSGQIMRLAGRAPKVCTDPTERERLRHATLAAERLSQVHFFLNEQNRSFGAGLECIHLAERLGPSPELARACATMCVAVGFLSLPSISERYGRRAQAIAEQVGDGHATAYVSLLRGLHAINMGVHADARRYLEHALRLALSHRDVRMGQEIQPLLGQAHNMAGRRESALACFAELEASAQESHNVQAMLWAKNGRATTLTWLGRAADAIALYEEIRPTLIKTGDATEVLSEGTLAFAYGMAGRWDDALAIADEIWALTRGVPTGWHCLLGYAAACETYLALLELDRRCGHSRSELLTRCAHVVRCTRAACRVFRMGASSAELFTGNLAWLTGDTSRARRSWRRALRHAEDLHMPMEVARAHYEIARHARADERAHHLSRAEALFRQVGAAYWLEQLARC